jgi:flagellar motor protein MotB
MFYSHEREHINIWLAYSDLFSGLLIVFVGLLLFHLLPSGQGDNGGSEELKRRREAQWNVTRKLFEEIQSRGYRPEPATLEKLKESFENTAKTNRDLLRFLDNRGNEAVILRNPEGEEQRITFGSQVLFDNEGLFRNKIKQQGVDLLRSIGPVILSQSSLYSEIRVFGHTDVKPPKEGDAFEYNWVLSSERAIAVVTELLTDPEIGKGLPANIKEEYDQYRRGKISLNFPPNRISAIGRGEFEPVESQTTDEWKVRQERIHKSWSDERKMQQNRRIEIVLRSLADVTRDSAPLSKDQ